MVRKMILFATVSLTLCALIAIPVALTSAQNQKGEKQAESKKEVKKPDLKDSKVALKDAVERVGPNQIRAKSGFKLVLVDDGWVVEQVEGKVTRRLEKRIKCGSCPGGTCRSRLNGSCAPRNSCTSSTCLIDPF